MRVGIDASRNRSGGAVAHLVGILSEFIPSSHGIDRIDVWSHTSLLDQLPDYPWLVKHSPAALKGSLLMQLTWQATCLSDEVKSIGCDIVFTTDASTLCRFKPMVVLSQDMLSYEPGLMQYFGYGYARLRLLAILAVQNYAFRRSNGVIFLTRYARDVIQKSCGKLRSTAVIPHGVDRAFKEVVSKFDDSNSHFECIYISNAEMYKHQWVVVEAISILRERNYDIKVRFVGGGRGPAQDLLLKAIAKFDPKGFFVEQLSFLPHASLPKLMSQANIFIFASSCENMPVTLIEGMAVGLPIACSNRGPMPEVLSTGGLYFNPEDAGSIAQAIEQLVISPELRREVAQRAQELSRLYSWRRCADETFTFLAETYRRTLDDKTTISSL